MAKIHGKNVVITIDGDDISQYCNSVNFNRSADSHDVTCFGQGSKSYVSGLKDGEVTVEGIYDSTAGTGPGAVFRPLVGGSEVAFTYKPEGTGVGKPLATVDVIVTAYEETAPVADMITFSATLQMSGDIADTTQA